MSHGPLLGSEYLIMDISHNESLEDLTRSLEKYPPLFRLRVVSKTIEHFKSELKAAKAMATDEQLKMNNLQKRLPKVILISAGLF